MDAIDKKKFYLDKNNNRSYLSMHDTSRKCATRSSAGPLSVKATTEPGLLWREQHVEKENGAGKNPVYANMLN